MLRIITSTSVAQAKKYYSEGFTREGYYSEGQEMVGHWGGHGASLLGLKGPVGKDDFAALCENLHPATGEKLTLRMKQNRRPGFDFNFNAPKSVSLAYEWTGDERILKAHLRAVQETMKEIEHEAATRVRTNGQDIDRKTGNLVWADFTHFTARPENQVPDPHLHSHVFVFNVTFDDRENRWKAAQIGDIKYDSNYFQAAYHARLATYLREAGYRVERVGRFIELAGISRSLIEKFSQRTKAILDAARKMGISAAAEMDGLAALTREKKIKDIPRSELHRLWWSRLTPEDRKELDNLGKGKEITLTLQNELEQAEREMELRGWTKADREAVAYAIEHIFERNSAVTERELITEALEWGYGHATVNGIRKVMNDFPLIWGEKDGRRLITTREVQEEENRIVEECKFGRGILAAINPGWKIRNVKLNTQQQEAVLHVLRSKDFITGISGRAGTGKTMLLQEAQMGIEDAGKKLFVFAPTAEVARGLLRKQGFENAETVAQLLFSSKLQDEVRRSIWWVDEAGLMSARSMDRLVKLASELDARIVLVGDTGQHHAVERGNAFELLQNFGGMAVASVEKIQRQKGQYRLAVEQIAEHKFDMAFKTLEEMGAFRELPLEKRSGTLAKDYTDTVLMGKSALVVAPTHGECKEVTNAIRQALKANKTLNKGHQREVLRNLCRTAAEKRNCRSYDLGQVAQINQHVDGFALGEQLEIIKIGKDQVVAKDKDGYSKELPLSKPETFSVYEKESLEVCAGDRIRITANGRTADRHRLENGNLFTVEKISREGVITLNNGWQLDSAFKHLDYGYATTSHASQGKTVDTVLIAQSGLYSSGASDANQFYVSVSRGREAVRIYTDDIDALRENVARVRERLSAKELTEIDKQPEEIAVQPSQTPKRVRSEKRHKAMPKDVRKSKEHDKTRSLEGRDAARTENEEHEPGIATVNWTWVGQMELKSLQKDASLVKSNQAERTREMETPQMDMDV